MRRAALLAALAVACASTPSTYAVHFAAAERAETAGRHGEAAREFDAASRAPASTRERGHAAYLSALEDIRAGDVADGAKRLETIAASRGEHAAEASWRLAQLDLASGSPNAKTEVDALLREFPNDGVAYPALRARLRLARAAGGEAEALSVLRALQPAVARTESAPRVAYFIADSLANLGHLAEARDGFVEVARRWPYPGEYFDDALWRASQCDEKLGRYRAAVDDLERMLSVLESSTLPGTYVRPRFPDAGWRIAELYRDRLDAPDQAVRAFDRYVSTFPNDVRRAEALWEAAKILRARGDESGACDRLERIARIAPDSRYVPCAAERCRGATIPKDSQAPKTCHAYLTR